MATIQKDKIVAELAGPSLLLPNLVAEAIAANGRIKFALSWLQLAEGTAIDGHSTAADLEPERALAGLDSDALYMEPTDVRHVAEGAEVPRSGAIIARILADLACMRAATESGANAGVLDLVAPANFREREGRIRQAAQLKGDLLPTGFVAELSRPPSAGRDSLHGLVMDMHKALNTIAAGLAEDDVGGAKIYRLFDDDKLRVAAFMRGLNRTAPLKFDHPGLATNATREGTRLIIQNDIGTTDAHVLIAQIESLRLSITYSDVHRERLDFFRRRLKDLSWTVTERRLSGLEEDQFSVATGIFDAGDIPKLDAVLELLGSSLVFLIDWNKARKSLRRLVPKSDAIALLDWAAEHECGHRGYLEVGGDGLIADLLETASKATGGFFTSLQRAVGDNEAVEFLRESLRIASVDLKAGRTHAAIRDVLRAELLARVASITDRILDVAIDHAALILDLGNLVRAALLDGRASTERAAGRAKAWEARADRQVIRIHELCGDGRERAWRKIASAADDAADNFEETAFRLRFLSVEVPADVRGGLLRLSEHAVAAVKEYVRLLIALRNTRRGASRQDMRSFLDLVEKLHDQEHATDDAERDVFSCLMRADVNAKTFTVVTAVAAGLEETGDALLRTARLISDHMLGEWFAT